MPPLPAVVALLCALPLAGHCMPGVSGVSRSPAHCVLALRESRTVYAFGLANSFGLRA